MLRKVFFLFVCSNYACFAGTAGPSDDEIFLFLIPLFLFIMYIGIPPLYRLLIGKIKEILEKRHLDNPENGILENGFTGF